MNAAWTRLAVFTSLLFLVAACGGGGGKGGGGGGGTTAPPAGPVSVAIGNLRVKGVVHSGFLVGTATALGSVSLVEVSLDGGTYQPATGTAAWKFQFPTGSNTWRDGSQHTVAVRATDGAGNTAVSATLTVRKGNNQDINGDGYADVAVGAYNAPSSAGAAYVFHGSSSGVASAASSAAATTLTGDAGSQFGISVALGDANGDGYADVAVGAPYATAARPWGRLDPTPVTAAWRVDEITTLNQPQPLFTKQTQLT